MDSDALLCTQELMLSGLVSHKDKTDTTVINDKKNLCKSSMILS